MTENLIAEIRQLLEDVVVPDLKAVMMKLDGIQRQLELTERARVAQMNLLCAELEALRMEIGTLRTEMRAAMAGDASAPSPQSEEEAAESSSASGKPDFYIM